MRTAVFTLVVALGSALNALAHDFFNLTAEQVRIDSLLPTFAHTFPLSANYADSTYEATIEYPEFIDMGEQDIARYKAITADTLPELPVVNAAVATDRKCGTLDVWLVPLVFRDGKYMKLVSFKLAIKARAKNKPRARLTATRAADGASRYAEHSVLSSGTWAKIRVAGSGVYQLTSDLARSAGFSDLSKVKIYGYGGALQPETLTGDYLEATDDLSEVATCTVNGRRLFRAQGPVEWNGANRTRNPYSDYGYYFLTESDGEPLTVDSAAFVSSFYPSGDDYNTLYEVDNYAWYHGGRNLYDRRIFTIGTPMTYTLAAHSAQGRITVMLSADAASTAQVSVNDSLVGTIRINTPNSYSVADTTKASYTLYNMRGENTIAITQTAGGTMRLDYIALNSSEPKAAPKLSSDDFPVPEYVHHITNQDHHGDNSVDMVIIIPTSQTLLAGAQRLKALHESRDSMSVRIVPADELYNEFASGTPDATAYRRYMKMLYDRAATEADMPRFLVLFGDGAWDNRMLTSDWTGYSPDDFLLCFESENSFSETNCYVSDDFFCMLDDEEAIHPGGTSSYRFTGKADVAVGRMPVRTAAQAEAMLSKAEAYIDNTYAGPWQNQVVVMGDDGNNNIHMQTAEAVAERVEQMWPGCDVKRIMWDAYKREVTSSGNSYPDVTALIKQYMSSGALIMNYVGHGAAYCLSHEMCILLNDFKSTVSNNLPLWITAACDILPFDGQEENIGEEAVLNENGGALAFYGTTRTVYSNYNEAMNLAFISQALNVENGRVPIGEAVRLAKNSLVDSRGDLTVNKLQYTLLGDPAIALAIPLMKAQVDTINGAPVGDSAVQLRAGETVSMSGHISNSDGTEANTFSGTLNATVKGGLEEIVCRLNDAAEASTPFSFNDRQSVVFRGTNTVGNGRFKFTFVVPKDITYSDATGLVSLYAVSDDKTLTATGAGEGYYLNGSTDFSVDSIGPAIYCYLNSSSFTNGDYVNPTPYFVAEIFDSDGINVSGTGIGHDLQLIIDGQAAQTYTLNDYFTFDFDSYQRGTVAYSIPTLAEGSHKLLFRAWDVLNNSSTSELTFNVSKAAQPGIIDIDCTPNPASTTTSFRIVHDRIGSELNIEIDVFDTAGRRLWTHSETVVPTSSAVSVSWNLTTSAGSPLRDGVYIYRVRASSDGSGQSSKAKKMIVLGNK